MDLLAILDEAASDQQRAKKSVATLCMFWENDAVFYWDFKGVRLEVKDRLDKEFPKRPRALQLLRTEMIKPKGTSNKFLRSDQIGPFALGEIRTCNEMATHSDKFELAIVTNRQADEFVTNVDKNEYCKHCEDVEVISWEYIEEACRIKLERVANAEERVDSSSSRSVPVDSTPRERWEMFNGLAREKSGITLVDQYIGFNKNAVHEAGDIECFFSFVDEDFSHNNSTDKSIIIYTTCAKNRIAEYENTLHILLKDKINLKGVSIAIHIFNPFNELAGEFPRERWLGFDDRRIHCHGIDFLKKAGAGEFISEFSKTEALKRVEIEQQLIGGKLSEYLDTINLT